MKRLIYCVILGFVCGGLGATQIEWTKGDKTPDTASLSVYLNGESTKKTVSRPDQGTWIILSLSKMMYSEDELTLIVKKDGKIWMQKHKRIDQDTSKDKIYLPPGKNWSLEIQSASGSALATVVFQ